MYSIRFSPGYSPTTPMRSQRAGVPFTSAMMRADTMNVTVGNAMPQTSAARTAGG